MALEANGIAEGIYRTMEVRKTPVIAALHGLGCATLLRSQTVEPL